MASDIDICNLALARLGDEANVSSINPPDQSAQANYCARFYPMSLASILDDHNWGFATKTITLALTTCNNSLWDYCYEAPSDMINIIAVFDSAAVGDVNYGGVINASGNSSIYGQGSTATFINRSATHGNQQAFSLEVDALGNSLLYTNQASAMLKYVAYVSDTTKFPPSFVDALAWKLASNLAGIIVKGDVGVAASIKCIQAYMAALENAKESDTQNRKVFPAPAPSGIAARA